ncbi:pyridoxamine 5'-phosphate oxidase family protein [Belnapia rosea]|uniref:pyridoxamine 5'-phosphate oxidase family protein n=1 Tax=Belnapia rosea TaxID=938405 RepID=UPI00088A88A8|nr:pyridoxamine 5'-phosphate oxidase family protein [Belnapia rosea]SDB69692.1 hypothetical protein SAMN02927895_03514 [Belnapia rosea]
MRPDPTPAAPSPWHAGERALHQGLGLGARMEEIGRHVLRDHMLPQHQSFFPALPFLVLGAVDAEGDAWATLRAGPPGFLRALDSTRLQVEVRRDPADPAEAGLEDGAAVAVLGIELATRRRNRLNGTLRRNGPEGFTVEVEQSFGNCPQYIQQREVAPPRDPPAVIAPPQVSRGLGKRARAMIAAADSFFVATYVEREDGRRQVDVSHRGGRPGFVRADDGGVLTIPDFAGNRFFNTLGNIVANPRAGLVFVDGASGDLLQMTGRAEVILDSPEIAAFRGAERLWRFTPEAVVLRPGAFPLRLTLAEGGWAPSTLATGSWEHGGVPS